VTEPKYIIEYLIVGTGGWRPLGDLIIRMDTPNQTESRFDRASMLQAEQIRNLFKAGIHYVTVGVTLVGGDEWCEVHYRLITIVHTDKYTRIITKERGGIEIVRKEREEGNEQEEQ